MKTFAVLFALLASAAVLYAQDDKQIQDAIRGLGAESFEEREKSTAELKKIGAPALEALKKAAKDSDDPEVRVRAQRLVDAISAPPPRKATAGRAPLAGPSIFLKQGKGTTVYSLKPLDGDAIELHRGPDDKVKLVYPDGKGGKAEAEAESIDKFLTDHKDLAAKYGITKDGIDYGGSKLSFTTVLALPAIPQLPGFDTPMVPLPPMQPREFDELFKQTEELRKAFDELRVFQREDWGRQPFFGSSFVRGVQIGAVPEVLRSQLAIPAGQGVVVEAVREGTTAAAAGLKRHDVLLEIDGTKVSQPADVQSLLKRDSKVKVLRAGKEQALTPAPAPKKEY